MVEHLLGDVNESLTNWETKFMEIIEMCIPKKSLPRRINHPWMTKNLMRAIRKRNGFFRRARQNGSQSLFDRYKQQRNRVVKEMQKAKGHFFKNFNPSSSKQFWKTVKIMNENNVSIPALVRN